MIIQGDILAWAESYDGEPFHALLCDPPYHMTEMTRRFGAEGAAPPKDRDGAYASHARGFMGQTWDGGDVAFRPETWAALARHLHPGAFGMAFASARGWHRMAVAMEDAGLIIHPTIYGWSYGSGFPKATRIDTQVDRHAGAERRVVGRRKHAPKFAAAEHGYREKDNGYNSREREAFDLTAPTTPMAQAWAGHRYGLQALKPALEPILVFQRPYQGPPVACITRTGAGAWWIDGGRVKTVDRLSFGSRAIGTCSGIYPPAIGWGEGRQHEAGRWPSNLLLSHLPTCAPEACAPGCAVAALGAQSGASIATAHTRGNGGGYSGLTTPPGVRGITDFGTAARYFFASDYALDRLEAADAVAYVAKASSAEKEAGLDPIQVALVRELYGDDLPDFPRVTVGDGRETPIDNAYQRGETGRRNIHPTLKPLTLTRYLSTLLLPPGDYAPRRLLVPFAGTGSELIGAMLAGWEEPYGVELDQRHVDIARARLRYWEGRRHQLDQGQPITVRAPRAQATTRSMFDPEEETPDAA